jgi:2-phospho-L-lactate guanylyltransferase
MNLWLLLPVKPFYLGKSRLAPNLSNAERASLSQAMFTHVLTTAQHAGDLAGAIVISQDQDVLALAQQLGAIALIEQAHDLNLALDQARRAAVALGADAVLVLPADLPLLKAADLRELCALGTADPSVVMAPSHDGGTNALLLHPANLIEFAFGVNSFRRHQHLAIAANVQPTVLDTPGLALDVDRPDDLSQINLPAITGDGESVS